MSEFSPPKAREWRPETALGPDYPPKPAEIARGVAIGNFDGAHRGHAAVARAARESVAAARPGRKVEILALTFEPHPRAFFQPEKPMFRLTPAALRAEALGRIGFDGVVVLPFGRALADLSPEAFVEEILIRRLGADAVAVGADFHFGKARAGTPDFLVAAGARHGFSVSLVHPVAEADGAVISSSAIRAALAAGETERAGAMLGAPFVILGPVVHGAKRGRELNYPTANIEPEPGCALRHGIYAIRAEVAGQRLGGVASFGTRPHFDNGAALLEVHLFDFSGDLYGKEMRVEFLAFLRGEAKFPSLEALIAQMDRDSAEARAILAGAPRPALRSADGLI